MSSKNNNNFLPLFIAAVSLIYFQGNVWSLLLGLLISAAGLRLRLKSAGYAASSDKPATAGPYSHSQNPHYLGSIILFTGIGIMSFALFPYFQILIPAVLYLYYRKIALSGIEEVKAACGSEWADYPGSVPLLGWRIAAYKGCGEYDASAAKKFESGTIKGFAFIAVTFLLIWIIRIF